MSVQPIEWLGDRLMILDQTKLPGEVIYLEIDDYRDVASAIADLKVRGAPAIGVAGAYGIALGALKINSDLLTEFTEGFRQYKIDGDTLPDPEGHMRFDKQTADTDVLDEIPEDISLNTVFYNRSNGFPEMFSSEF